MKITAVIPIRAQSKGLPGKNTRDLAGKPLFMHAVACAQAADISDIVVATDDAVLLQASSDDYRAFARSAHSARDEAPTHEVLIEVVSALGLEDHLIVLLQATSPLRQPKTVQAVIAAMQDGQAELGCSVSQIDSSLLKSGTIIDGYLQPTVDASTLFRPRQSLPDLFKMDGGVYAFMGGWLVRNRSLETEKIKVVQSDPAELLDIDTMDDFVQAQAILRAGNSLA